MARTANDHAKDILGDSMMEIIRLRTENGQLKEENDKLKTEKEDLKDGGKQKV